MCDKRVSLIEKMAGVDTRAHTHTHVRARTHIHRHRVRRSTQWTGAEGEASEKGKEDKQRAHNRTRPLAGEGGYAYGMM